jgi:hypothetical protein
LGDLGLIPGMGSQIGWGINSVFYPVHTVCFFSPFEQNNLNLKLKPLTSLTLPGALPPYPCVFMPRYLIEHRDNFLTFIEYVLFIS